ncbi:MAG: DUF983 domain-containing protein [Flavobacteriaceae bacterium]
MLKKGNKLYSVLMGKCPRCHEGDFFEFPFTFHPKKITKLHKNCPSCNLKYMIEPSFFYGAMYVNYGITVALSIITFLLAKLVFAFSLLQSFAAIFLVLLLLAPFNLRVSRVIWINMFVKFDPNHKSK